MATDQNITPELQQRIDLGKAGKLWRIEVLFKEGVETRRYELRDRTGREVMDFREKVFKAGLMIPVSPGMWRIVSPFDLLEITVYRQQKYYGDNL
jgi:hypothetical protein